MLARQLLSTWRAGPYARPGSRGDDIADNDVVAKAFKRHFEGRAVEVAG
jgi:hypothetical protein